MTAVTMKGTKGSNHHKQRTNKRTLFDSRRAVMGMTVVQGASVAPKEATTS